LLGALAFGACAWGARGAPHVTLLNTGIRIEHPHARGAWGLAGAGGLALLATVVPRRALRFALAGAAVLAAAVAAQRLVYRLEAGPQALVVRSLFGESVLPWREVSRVDSRPEELVVWGRQDAQIRVAMGPYPPDLRVTLERAISRRVAESRATAR
jgi:hypothetical protein